MNYFEHFNNPLEKLEGKGNKSNKIYERISLLFSSQPNVIATFSQKEIQEDCNPMYLSELGIQQCQEMGDNR